MKRLIRISVNTAVLSIIPILSWFALSIIVDKNLINVFTLTYPIQFIWCVLKAVFGTGANICKEKEGKSGAVLSGIILGAIVGFIVFFSIGLNIDSYIQFMNMEVEIYRDFAIYVITQLYIQLIFVLVLEKLYFEDKNKLANKYCIILNMLNFVILIITSLIFKENMYIIGITLTSIAIYTLFVTIKQFKKFKLTLNIIAWIKYESLEIFNNLAYFLIFLFGLSNALEFGTEFAFAINFVALITDAQWDALMSIGIISKIDISKKIFNYKEHLMNAYRLLFFLMITTGIMFIGLYSFYDLNLRITIIFLMLEAVSFLLYPITNLKTNYLQLEYSPVRMTGNKIISSVIRFALSLLSSPYCTAIGQIASTIYQYITVNIIFKLNYKLNKKGEIVTKTKQKYERKTLKKIYNV